MTVNFPPWKRFFDFSFRSYSCFRKKNPADGSKSLPPSHLWEFRLPVTALALSARRPFGPARFARGLDKEKHLERIKAKFYVCRTDHHILHLRLHHNCRLMNITRNMNSLC